MNPIKHAAEIVGSQQKLAQLLGVSKGAVTQWITKGVPIDRCIDIERITQGRVRCEELNASIDWPYLRATDCPTHNEAA